jgi:hypothetical protein
MLYPLTSTYPRYKEFQEMVWHEIQKTPPKLILDAAAIPTSILWDETADLDIMDRLNSLTKEDYVLDRAMLITGAHGEWIGADDNRLQQGVPCIRVFRRKD